jgi:hypothetical protein
MNKLEPISTSIKLSTDFSSVAAQNLEAASWLIVLVPHTEADLSAAIRRVWELANAGSSRVRFIGLYENAIQELTLRRQLAGMSAMLGSTGIYTETEALSGNDWAEIVRARWHAGDLVVCFADQRVGPLKRSLSSMLQSSLDVPIYILSGSYLQNNVPSNWWAGIFAWGGFIAILAGFFLLQVRIHHLMGGWNRPVLVLISVCLELWMVWVWKNCSHKNWKIKS